VKAVVGGTLVDGTGAEPREDSVIVIDGETIGAVGAKGEVKIPSGAEVVEVHGRTVVPGLIEGHNHPLGERDFGDPGFKKYYDNMVHSPALALLKGVQVIQGLLTEGVTTVRIPHPAIANAPSSGVSGSWP